MKKIIDVKEVGRRTSKSDQTVRKWIKLGMLKAINLNPHGGRPTYGILEEELDRFLQQGLSEAPAEVAPQSLRLVDPPEEFV